MTPLVQKLERLTITVVSPDGNLRAKANSERVAQFRLRDDVRFDSYDETTLAHQVTAVLTALNDGRQRGIEQIRQRPMSTPNQPHWEANHRRYHAALDDLTVTSRSTQGFIKIRAGNRLALYQTKVHPQAVNRLDADGFLAELHSAYHDLLTAHRVERSGLMRRHRLR